MKVMIVGAGRMGMRHAQGVLRSRYVTKLLITDILPASLASAKDQLKGNNNIDKVSYALLNENETEEFDIVIFATTAKDRFSQYLNVLSHKPKFILFEKPLGQSLGEVERLIIALEKNNVKTYVNLNMRMYDFIKELKTDLDSYPQFAGIKSINFTGGSLGIGANGIHYLDLLIFLFSAARCEIQAGEIDQEAIPSGRGPEFTDHGGWAVIKFFGHNDQYLGNSYISLSANSSVFGGWEIIGRHGRIRINELEGQRTDILRDENSTMPINRYAADYLTPVTKQIASPNLGDLTYQWIDGLANGIDVLPSLNQSLGAHKLLFNWLSLNKTGHQTFSIT